MPIMLKTGQSYSEVKRIVADVNGTYTDCFEVRDNQNNLLWAKLNTFTGTSSVSFKGYALPVDTFTITGSASGVGEPYTNLFNKNSMTTNENGQERPGIECPAGTYTINNTSTNDIYYRRGIDTATTEATLVPGADPVTVTSADVLVVWTRTSNTDFRATVNEGTISHPYTEYGVTKYFIPIDVNGTIVCDYINTQLTENDTHTVTATVPTVAGSNTISVTSTNTPTAIAVTVHGRALV